MTACFRRILYPDPSPQTGSESETSWVMLNILTQGSRKKSSFFSGPATKALLELSSHRNF